MPKYTTYTFRVPIELKDALKADAIKHSRSANAHVVKVLGAYLRGELVAAEKLLSEPGVMSLIKAAITAAGQGRRARRKR